jgi:glycyl-tRNA synthetase beta chain
MTDFLLELRSEEIPARMQERAKDDLARLFNEALAKAGLASESVETFATPRRLALIAKGLPLETKAVSEETKGPKLGAPPQALEGFLRKVGLSQDQLVERDGVLFAVVNKPGRKTADVLAEAIPAIIRAFPWPKSQRWGAASITTESLRWVRPLQGIIALLGDDVVPCAIEGVQSGRETVGHRFMRPDPTTVSPEPVEGRVEQNRASTSSALTVVVQNASTYVADLRAAHVIVHYSERCAIIRDGAQAAAKAAGLVLVEDEGLVSENAGLTEWPVPMLGRFDPPFLAVPEEVIQLTARVNQKYFVCQDAGGKLANAFVCTANIVAHDGGAAIVAGNEKVLAARLSDAKFFWEQDLKIPLDEQAGKLSQITFHEKLGTVADKVERVAKLARWLVEEGIVSAKGTVPSGTVPNSDLKGSAPMGTVPMRGQSLGVAQLADVSQLAKWAERAARLCKADLVTGMVGEFPELQGIMGGYYARAQGEPDAVADAVRDHYKPVGQGDDVPTAPVTVAVSLADKLDTLSAFFYVDEKPTGSKDPFALRRAALSILQVVENNKLRLPLMAILKVASGPLSLSTAIAAFKGQPLLDILARGFPSGMAIGEAKEDGTHDLSIDGINLESVPNQFVQPLIEWMKRSSKNAEWPSFVLDFFADRLKVQQREAGVRHDLIDAVFALGGEDDLVRLLARVKALQAFVGTDEGANLLAGYKRAANILKQAGGDGQGTVPSGTVPNSELKGSAPLGTVPMRGQSLAEEQLLDALNAAEPKAITAIEAEQFEDAMAALASLRAPIDAFFDGVMVNDPDPEKRAFRLGLLARFRDAVHRVADFSRIEG